jgi:hypothetical protein
MRSGGGGAPHPSSSASEQQQQQHMSLTTATTTTTPVTLAVSSSASFSSSGGNNNGKSRKEQITERLSRSRRSRFFGPAIGGGGNNITSSSNDNTTHEDGGSSSSSNNAVLSVGVPSSPAAERRIALARAHSSNKKQPQQQQQGAGATPGTGAKAGGGFAASPRRLASSLARAVNKSTLSSPAPAPSVSVVAASAGPGGSTSNGPSDASAAAATAAAPIMSTTPWRRHNASLQHGARMIPSKAIPEAGNVSKVSRYEEKAAETAATTTPERPRLCLGASPRADSASSSSAVKGNDNNDNSGTDGGGGGTAIASLSAPNLRGHPESSRKQQQQQPSNVTTIPSNGTSGSLGSIVTAAKGSRGNRSSTEDEEEEGVESIVLLQSSSTASSSSSLRNAASAAGSSRSGSAASGDSSMPQELPAPTFGASGTGKGSGAPKRQWHKQVVIPVQAPPAAISRPSAHLPKSSAGGEVSKPGRANVAVAALITDTAESESASPTNDSSSRKTSPKQMAVAIAAASSSDAHSLSRWRRGSNHANAHGSATASAPNVNTSTGSGTASNDVLLTTTTTTSSSNPSAAVLPHVHLWMAGLPSTTATTVEEAGTSSSADPSEAPAATPPSPRLSPTRINPWKQMSKVRSTPSKDKVEKNDPTAGSSSTPQPGFMQQLRARRDAAAAASSTTNAATKMGEAAATTTPHTIPSRVADRWGGSKPSSHPVDRGDVDAAPVTTCPSSESHGSHRSASSFGDEEKKEDADGYIDPPVNVSSMKARYGSQHQHGSGGVAMGAPFLAYNRSQSPSLQPAAFQSRSKSPYGGGRRTAAPSPGPFQQGSSSPIPAYPRMGQRSSTPTLSGGAATEPLSVTQGPAQDEAPRQAGGGAVIETPDKVSVSSMKARFASPTVASSSRGGASKSPGPASRFPKLAQQQQHQPTLASPRSQSVGKSRAVGSPNPGAARSSSVGRFASPTMASQKRSGSSPCPPVVSGVETHDHGNGSSMTARFAKPTVSKASFLQPTLSSAAKCSPRKDPSSAPASPLHSSTAVDASNVLAVGEPRSTIETPEPVNVKSMQGMFSGNASSKKKVATRGIKTSTSPFRNSPAMSPPLYGSRQTYRERSIDVATPNAPPLPSRSNAKAASQAPSPTPSWVKRSPVPDDAHPTSCEPGDHTLSSLAMPALEESEMMIVKASTSRDLLPSLRPKSPRERPSSIPRWKQLQAIDSGAPESGVPSSTLEKPDVDIPKQEACPPSSPRSQMERPWNKDLESPRGWRQRLQATFSERAKPALESDHGTHMNPPANSSLTQLAADSVHAIDFDQGIPIPELKKSSGSGSRDYEDSGSGGGAIPTHLPAEFAESLELHLDSKSIQRDRVVQRNVLPVRVVDEPETEPQSSSGIVFGDPSTYGAAGGDAEATPPRVKDRALAIAHWKGGLGAKPNKSISDEAETDVQGSNHDILDDLLASESTQDEDRITRSREEPDRVSQSREEPADHTTQFSSPLSSPAGSRRVGASAVLRFWDDTSREEFDGAQEWMNCDPDLNPQAEVTRPESPSLRKRFISNAHKPRVEDINLSSLSQWKRLNSPPSDQKSPAPPDMFPTDPFALETLAGLYEEPTKGVPTAFDPFADSRPAEEAFDNSVMDFFNASIQVPSSPAPTTFSAPNFEPKVFENPNEDKYLDSFQPDRRETAPVALDGRRRSSWGLGGRKSKRSNAI